MNATQDAFAALRYRDFSIVTLNQFCLTLAILIQEIIVAYSLYKITKDSLTLGLIGLAEAIPFIALSLWGGYFADRFNKQTIMKICLFFAIPLPLILWGLFHAYTLKQIELSTLSWGVYAVILRARTEEGFDFAGVFGGRMREVKGIEYLNARRLWRALRRFNPSANFDPLSQSFPLFVRPEKKLSVQDLMGALRDRFEGTEYDAFPAEGGFGSHRPIGVPSCVHSNVIELRSGMPADVGAVLWGLLGSPHTSPYIPLHLGVKTLPTPYMTASSEYDAHCAFWAFRKLTNLVMVNFRELFPLVSAEWQALEKEAFSLKPDLEETALKTWASDPGRARHMLGLFADSFARRALEKADVLAELLNTEIARGIHRPFSHEELSW